MRLRLAGLVSVGLALAAGLSVAALSAGSAETLARRIAFQIATGQIVPGAASAYFPIGELIAGLISHPPGVARCPGSAACGPRGLIATARTSDGAVANVMGVNDGQMESGLAETNVVADAVAGKGAFRKSGKQTHVRVIAALFPEDVHLVAAPAAKISDVAGLRGKRVSLGGRNSANLVTARQVLAAFRVPEHRLKVRFESSDEAARQLEKGTLDAFFFVGGAPVPLIRDLVARKKAVLVAITGKGRERLLRAMPGLDVDTIPPGAYPGAGRIETVRGRTLWIVNDAQPEDLVYSITRALFDPANRDLLDHAGPDARAIRLQSAALNLPAPLHPGAARFYRETGKLLPGKAAASKAL